jgi:hypothetical protein
MISTMFFSVSEWSHRDWAPRPLNGSGQSLPRCLAALTGELQPSSPFSGKWFHCPHGSQAVLDSLRSLWKHSSYKDHCKWSPGSWARDLAPVTTSPDNLHWPCKPSLTEVWTTLQLFSLSMGGGALLSNSARGQWLVELKAVLWLVQIQSFICMLPRGHPDCSAYFSGLLSPLPCIEILSPIKGFSQKSFLAHLWSLPKIEWAELVTWAGNSIKKLVASPREPAASGLCL